MASVPGPAALLKLSRYFCRPYFLLVTRLLNENRITRKEALEVVNGVGVAFDALADEIPELQEHRDILTQE